MNHYHILLLITLHFALIASQLSYQSVFLSDKVNVIEISYNPEHLLSDGLNDLFYNLNLSKIQLQMGFTTNDRGFPLQKGIFLFMSNRTQFDPKIIKILGQVFLISRDQENFYSYLSEVELVYVSNPNDKFCSQHLHNLIQIFFPCKDHSGFGSLINRKDIFTKQFLGIDFIWTQNRIILRVYLPQPSNQNGGKIKDQKSLPSSHCSLLDKKLISRDEPKLSERYLQKNINEDTFQELFVVKLESQWYAPQKQLMSFVNLVDFQKKYSKLNQNTKIQSINFKFSFPEGFDVQSVESNCQQKCLIKRPTIWKHIFSVKVIMSEKYIQTQGQQFQLRIRIRFKAGMKGFQKYETISGGGEQFMKVPSVVTFQNGKHVLVISDDLSERLLQPDFSIPFHTITFTIAIMGYLWVSIWRSYFSQLKQKLN